MASALTTFYQNPDEPSECTKSSFHCIYKKKCIQIHCNLKKSSLFLTKNSKQKLSDKQKKKIYQTCAKSKTPKTCIHTATHTMINIYLSKDFIHRETLIYYLVSWDPSMTKWAAVGSTRSVISFTPLKIRPGPIFSTNSTTKRDVVFLTCTFL